MPLQTPQDKSFFWFSIAAMSMAAVHARLAVGQAKLATWRAAHGIEMVSDLAFYFMSYGEATPHRPTTSPTLSSRPAPSCNDFILCCNVALQLEGAVCS